MSAGEGMKRLACNEVLGDLSFELNAMGAVLGHGFHPLKARQPRSIPNLQSVHRQGRTPCGKSAASAAVLAPMLNASANANRLMNSPPSTLARSQNVRAIYVSRHGKAVLVLPQSE